MKRSILSLIAMSCIVVSGCGGGSSSEVNDGNSGSLDSSFASYFTSPDGAAATALQSDGKILVGGRFSTYNSKNANNIVRLNTDGTIDTSFNTGTGADDKVIGILVQADGKIIVTGGFWKFNNVEHGSIVRLNSDGSVDTTFNSGTGFSNEITEAILQPDGKILVAGRFSSYNGTSCSMITRLNGDGTIDSTFGGALPAFTGSSPNITAIALQKNGKIIIGGNFTTTATDSGSGGASVSAYRKAYAPIPVMLLTYNNIARLNSDGSIDASFYSDGTDSNIYTIAVQSDDKIIIGGSFTKYNTTGCNRIMRLKADGSPDLFNTGTGFDESTCAIKLQDDGKILVGGAFSSFNGAPHGRIVRLNSDGSIDTGFNTGTGTDAVVYSVGFTKSGNILIGGAFKTYNGQNQVGIACLYK